MKKEVKNKNLNKNKIKVFVFKHHYFSFIVILLMLAVIISAIRMPVLEGKASTIYGYVIHGEKEESKVNENPNPGNVRSEPTPERNYEFIEVTPEQLDSIILSLKDDEIIKSLHEDSIIYLKVDDFEYTVEKGNIQKGKPEKYELTLSIPAKYIGLVDLGLCETIKAANQNKDLGIETHASKFTLSWHFKGLMKYKECLS